MSEPVPTGCSSLDDLLGGGFERGTVTQVYGPPAAGKTNLALSAAVQVAVSGGTAVYIDTEGLSVDRFQQLAAAAVSGGSEIPRATGEAGDSEGRGPSGNRTRSDDSEGRGPSGNRTRSDDSEGRGPSGNRTQSGDSEDLDAVTSRIVVSEAHDFAEQEEAVRDAADFAPRAELIVLDSATGFYRLERHDDDEGETLRRVGRQVTHLLSLARKHDLAAVVTNQVFTDPEGDRSRGLGGHTLDHWTGTVVRLDRFRGGNRRATLEKHRSKPAGETATFRITGEGLAAGEETL